MVCFVTHGFREQASSSPARRMTMASRMYSQNPFTKRHRRKSSVMSDVGNKLLLLSILVVQAESQSSNNCSVVIVPWRGVAILGHKRVSIWALLVVYSSSLHVFLFSLGVFNSLSRSNKRPAVPKRLWLSLPTRESIPIPDQWFSVWVSGSL